MEPIELKVSAIENGTVIDHIPAENVFKVIKILGLDKFDDMVLFGTNLDSKKFGKKGIIKVANKFFQSEEINKIALIAPSVTLTIIKDYKKAEKRNIEVPDTISNYVKCVNPNCITNNENVISRFNVISKVKGDIKLQCHYCEKITDSSNMKFILNDQEH